MSELYTWTASETAAAIRCGRISSVEATEAALARMDAVNGAINAVVDPLPEEAMEAARAADAALASGAPVGPLHGVPLTVKINVDYNGRATTNGVVAFKDLVAPDDGSVVRNLRAGGAVIVGRTNTPSFSMRWFTENDLHGTTLNPHDPAITPGGSSGGAGAALAAGIGAVAHGNDLGGSVRWPAYCCGLYGLRPTSGIVPAYNPSLSSERLIVSQMSSVQGPLARSMEDIAITLEALAAPDPRDIWQTPPAPGFATIARRPARVAMLAETDTCPVAPEVTDAIRRAGAILADAGYTVEEVVPPSLQEVAELWRLILANEIRAGLGPVMIENADWRTRLCMDRLLDGVPDLSGRDGFLKAFARRSAILRQWQTFFADWPIVLTAVSWQLPFAAGTDLADGLDYDTFFRQLAPVGGTPIIGLPGLSVPMGFAGTAPVGVQLLATRFGEADLLAAGAVLERASGPVAPVDPRPA
ncbi:amidase [Acuticoccus sediminis]|uniref:amidase n=1 Tax=Acuticoccus sediminis TaxID=2184697 RepID=UPI001CFD0511|nr:amidase [Acuticoccus sediminis]